MRWLLREQGLQLRSVAAASAMVFAMSACAGTAAAPKTVGPTAGEGHEIYEATVPPYDVGMDLNENQREELDQLFSLIDLYTVSSGGDTERHEEQMSRLSPHLDEEFINIYEEFLLELDQANQTISGTVHISDATVESYDQNSSATVTVCNFYTHWGPVDSVSGEPESGGRAERTEDYKATYYAERVNGEWKLLGLSYPGERCNAEG